MFGLPGYSLFFVYNYSPSRWLGGLIYFVPWFHHPWKIGFPGNFQYDDKKQLDLSEWNKTPQLMS